MQFKIVLPIFLSFVCAFSALATEKTLCVVSSDIDSDTAKIVIEMDQDNREIKHLYQETYHDSKLSARVELSPAGLKTGIVLNRKDKYITVRMHSDNFDLEQGGVLYLDTLYSGVSGERREYEMELAMDTAGPVLIQDKEIFTKIRFIAKRSKILGIIGIEKAVFGIK